MPDADPPAPGDRGEDLSFGLLPGLLGYSLRRAQVAVFQDFQAALADYGLTPGQFGVLVLIRENPGLSQSELGAALRIDRSTMVAVIDKLEARSLVERAPSPRDRRSYALHLTATGDRVLAAMIPRVEAHERAIARDLSPAERATLQDLLGRLTPPDRSSGP